MSNGLGLALPIRLTSTQIDSFLFRHPIVSSEIAETEAVMKFGLYDYDYNPATEWKMPGVIPPWGLQEQDSEFGLVTVFPARDGTWIYSGNSPDLQTSKPDYTSPTYPDGMLSTVAQDIVNGIKSAAMPIMVVGLLYLFLTSRRGN